MKKKHTISSGFCSKVFVHAKASSISDIDVILLYKDSNLAGIGWVWFDVSKAWGNEDVVDILDLFKAPRAGSDPSQ